jgi:hypothetical protein
MVPGILDAFPKVAAHQARYALLLSHSAESAITLSCRVHVCIDVASRSFEEIPAIKAYHESPRYLRRVRV